MSCLEITPAMADLLARLEDWPNVDIDNLQGRPEWAQARAWGWIMESGELTGQGMAHRHELPKGIVSD